MNHMRILASARLCPKTQSERSHPRSGDIFVEQRCPVNPETPEERHILAPINGLINIKESFLSTNISCLTALKKTPLRFNFFQRLPLSDS